MMNEMDMQESERRQQSDQEWQTNQPYGGYRAEYQGRYEPEPEQQQKIYPQAETGQRGAGTLLGIVAILLSSIGFFLAVAGIVGSAIVLQFANGQQALIAGGAIGLVASILSLLIFVAIFVVSIIVLANRYGIRRFRGRIRWR
jgi:hypothetical protein